MMDWNPVKKWTAYMVVGVKSCLDTKVSEIRKFDSNLGDGTELPLDAALAASGIVLPVAVVSLDIAANAKQSMRMKVVKYAGQMPSPDQLSDVFCRLESASTAVRIITPFLS